MKLRLVYFFLFMSILLCGQVEQSKLYPDLTGDELLEKVVSEYKADILFFDYGTARDTMFREVYAVNDSLECIYSGHKLYMDPSRDPTTTVYMNGADNGINTEHTYPQSKGAGFGNARSDMHHLYPARAMVNEERSNFPFGDIDDDKATKWFWKNQTLITKPSEDLDKYSEWRWQVFEPRESVKGNIARSVMYFYTMYKNQADAEDPDFFWEMLPDLCEWHFEDPVDSAEYARTWLISKWQQYPNPFVLDCSLVSRSYCMDIVNEECELSVPVQEEVKSYGFEVNYNSESKLLTLFLPEFSSNKGRINIYNISGQLLKSDQLSTATMQYFDLSDLSSGSFIVKVIREDLMESKLIIVE